jgi:hypothetical protein
MGAGLIACRDAFVTGRTTAAATARSSPAPPAAPDPRPTAPQAVTVHRVLHLDRFGNPEAVEMQHSM